MEQKRIPYSQEAENYIIGCMLIDPSVVNEVINRITENDFYIPENKYIVKAINNLYQAGIEVEEVKVVEELKRLKVYEASGGLNYLVEISESVPSVANITSYIEVIEEKSLLRELYNVSENICKEILAGKDNFVQIGEKAELNVVKVIQRRKTGDVKKIHRFTDKVIELVERNKAGDLQLIGLDTGFEELNKYTSGLQRGELIILAARPGIGKSAFAMNIATNACQRVNATVAFFSLEMSSEQLTGRILSSFSGISYKKIRNTKLNSKDMTSLMGAQATVNKLNLYLDEECNTNLSDIRAKCLKLKREGNLDLIVVDYLQLVTDTSRANGNRQEEVSRISRGLKKMARDFNVPVLALSQLSRQIDLGDDKTKSREPSLAHLRESGSIEQDADVVMFLHRDKSRTEEEVGRKIRNQKVKLIVAKNRQGELGDFELLYKGAQFTFCPYEDDRNDSEDYE